VVGFAIGWKRFRYALGGVLVLASCYVAPCGTPAGIALAQSSAPGGSGSPGETSPEDKQSKKYDGFYFRVFDQLNSQEVAERVVIRVMTSDGSDKIMEFNLDGGQIAEMHAYDEEPSDTPTPATKHFEVEISIKYLPKNSDGSIGEPVQWAGTRSMDIPFKANYMIMNDKDGSVFLKPM